MTDWSAEDPVARLAFCLQASNLMLTGSLRAADIRAGFTAGLSLSAMLSASETWMREAERWHASGIKPLVLGEPDYPRRLSRIDAAPVILYVRGKGLHLLTDPPYVVALIGTRRPTGYGIAVTRHIVSGLAGSPVLVVSGLARGIDSAVHLAALDESLPCAAVLAHGLDSVYPPENTGLLRRVEASGFSLSEFAPETPAQRRFFPARNRILSGLCDAVAVMEARAESGTMITTGFAADQGRDVFAVPGGILSADSRGCHRLLRDGAYLLEQASDLFAQIPGGLPRPELPQHADLNVDDLDRRRFARLRDQILSLDQLAAELEIAVDEAARWLTRQEAAGRIERQRGCFVLTAHALNCI